MGYIEEKIDDLAGKFSQAAELDRVRREASLAESLRGLRLDGALSRPIRGANVVYSTGGRLVGWSLQVVNSDVTVTFHDGQDANADPIATTVIKAGTSHTVGLPGVGVSFVDALFAEVTFTTPGPTVSLTGAVWIGNVD